MIETRSVGYILGWLVPGLGDYNRPRGRDAMVAREWMQKHMRDLMRGWLLGGHGMDSRIDPALTF